MQANKERQSTQGFLYAAVTAARHYQALGNREGDGIGGLVEALGSNGMVLRGTSERYDQDLEIATRNATQRPFGIELNTLSPNIQLILYPRMIFHPSTEDIEAAKEEDIITRTDGPQAMLYILDGFTKESSQVENLTANLLFAGHMTDALLEARYPLEREERSPEFMQQVRECLGEVRRYIGMLDIAARAKLTPRIARLGTLDDEELAREARNFCLYEVEPLKMPGLYEPQRDDVHIETPQEAVQNGNSYLHVTERNLPLRPGTARTKDIPKKPWVEYGRNRWNRSHQLFGRYELEEAGLKVDFRFDSTHFPGKYHFFDKIEITQEAGGERKQVILGQEVDPARQAEGEAKAWSDPSGLDNLFHKADFVFPVILAGDFDFSSQSARRYLGQLANDKGTKPDVAVVLEDILTLASQGQLRTLEGYLRRN